MTHVRRRPATSVFMSSRPRSTQTLAGARSLIAVAEVSCAAAILRSVCFDPVFPDAPIVSATTVGAFLLNRTRRGFGQRATFRMALSPGHFGRVFFVGDDSADACGTVPSARAAALRARLSYSLANLILAFISLSVTSSARARIAAARSRQCFGLLMCGDDDILLRPLITRGRRLRSAS
jgi:hypothetical protein